jgi:hypothetical protein
MPGIIHSRDQLPAFIPADLSFNLRRFAEILGAVGFPATGEAVKLGISRYPGNLVMHSVAAQHAKMTVMIGSAVTFLLIIHVVSTFLLCDQSCKSVPILAGNVLKENA